jgi:DNA-binding NtrC family response regulator
MNPLFAILVCDRDAAFREALRNFLFTAGYTKVHVVSTMREALAMLRRESYQCVLVGVSRSHLVERRLMCVVQRRQPKAKILFLISASDLPFVQDTSFVYVIKERAFTTLSELLAQNGNDVFATSTENS